MRDSHDQQTADLFSADDVPHVAHDTAALPDPVLMAPADLCQQASHNAACMFKRVERDGYIWQALHCYTDATGQPLYWKTRAKHPDTGDKWIRAFHWDGQQFVTKEPPRPDTGKPLYGLHLLVNTEPAQPVWIVEGEQKADALNRLGLIATTSGGKSSAASTDWMPLVGRSVTVWPDHDDAGQQYADDVAKALTAIGCPVSVVDTASLALPSKGDVMDWLTARDDAGLTTASADVEALARTVWQPVAEPVADHADAGPLDEDAELARLAGLSPLDYDRQRNDAAKALGIRPATLDKTIRGIKAELEEQVSAAGFFEVVDPWPDPVNGAAVLDEIVSIVHRHIACEKTTANATALWITFTWCIDAAHIAPIACITAPEKRCGKTQLLSLIGKLCRDPMPASNITAAALFRSIEKWQPTLLIDEADSFMKESEDLRGIINAGHSRDNAYVIRTTGDNHEPTAFNVWGAKAISGIGHLPDTIRDRSVLLELRRKQAHEVRQRLRHADPDQFLRLRRQLARWRDDNLDALAQARPDLPDAINDRAQDNWEILLAIADLAGNHWPDTARHAALSISGIEQATPSINEELLADIKAIFERTRQDRISSAQLLDYLTEDDESAWASWNRGRPMTPRQLAQRLGEFGIRARQMRFGNSNHRGFEIGQFSDAFTRYLPEKGKLSATTLQPLQHNGYSVFSSATQTEDVADKNGPKTLQRLACSTVADKSGLSGNETQRPPPVAESDPLKLASGWEIEL